MARLQREVEGVVRSGLGDGASFTQLPWAANEFRAKLGFEPYPGTFNLELQGPDWQALRRHLMGEAGIAIEPEAGFCAAKCFPVVVNDSVAGAAVFPDVAGYPEDKFEILAPVSVREKFDLRDGDRATVRIPLGRTIAGIILDIDGSVAWGDRPIPGAPEALAELRRRGVRLAFFTNDNQRTVPFWVDRLGGMGVEVRPEEIMTSAVVAARVVDELYPGRKVLAIGDVGLREAARAQGLNTVGLERAMEAEVVVVGKDPDFTQTMLDTVCRAVWNGAAFVATNYDAKVPVADGFVPASGPMVKAIAYATGQEPLIAGKPSRWAVDTALRALDVPAEQAAVVGDQLEQDVRMGREAGLLAVAVLTGATTVEAAAAAPAAARPDLILPDISHLPAWLDGAE